MSKIFQYPFRPLNWDATPHDFTGDNQLGIYTTETTQRYVYGTRYLMWDGRVYKYCNAVAVVYSYWGAHAYEDAALSWTSNAVVAYAGDRSQTVAVGSRSEDDLAGAYLMTEDNSATTTTCLQGIVGNEASVDSTTIIYTDSPIPFTTTSSDHHELYENPYRETRAHGGGYTAIIAVPAQTSQAGYKYWGQTYGPAYISPTNSTVDDPAANERTLYFSGSGVGGGLVEAAVSGATSESQHAGFILNADVLAGGGIAGPLIMLTISV